MARLACTEFDADWVINADADEAFVWRDGTLREALQRVPTAAHSLIANRTDFVPFERPGRRSPFIEMVYRMAVSMNVTGQPLPPKVLHRGVADVVISQGNHRAHSSQFVGGPAPGPIEVFHYPVRSFTQFASKVHNGGSGYARNRELSPKTGVHKRRWYEQLLQGELEDEYQQNLFFDAVRLQDSLASGTVLLDRTLADRMASLPGFNADGAASVP